MKKREVQKSQKIVQVAKRSLKRKRDIIVKVLIIVTKIVTRKGLPPLALLSRLRQQRKEIL